MGWLNGLTREEERQRENEKYNPRSAYNSDASIAARGGNPRSSKNSDTSKSFGNGD